jgi:geranylgeranyl pyrophosphate synthase
VTEDAALWQALSDYAENLGLAFQVTDDLLDVFGDAEKMGKNTGSDASIGKTTFLNFCSAEEASSLTDLLLERGEGALAPFEGSELLCELIRSLNERTH